MMYFGWQLQEYSNVQSVFISITSFKPSYDGVKDYTNVTEGRRLERLNDFHKPALLVTTKQGRLKI